MKQPTGKALTLTEWILIKARIVRGQSNEKFESIQHKEYGIKLISGETPLSLLESARSGLTRLSLERVQAVVTQGARSSLELLELFKLKLFSISASSSTTAPTT